MTDKQNNTYCTDLFIQQGILVLIIVILNIVIINYVLLAVQIIVKHWNECAYIIDNSRMISHIDRYLQYHMSKCRIIKSNR